MHWSLFYGRLYFCIVRKLAFPVLLSHAQDNVSGTANTMEFMKLSSCWNERKRFVDEAGCARRWSVNVIYLFVSS